MASWDMGYQTDLLYTTGYYGEISPVHLNFILTMRGYECPALNEPNTEVTACELGFGQGLSITINAMTAPVHWYGNDFNPSQVRFAQNLVRQAGLKSEQISLYDDSFEEFLDREDLPMFDYICLHGIWSWVSPENQHYIVEFIRKKLKLGGVVYISYNSAPGFTLFEPIRHLMYRYDKDINGPHINEREKFANIAKFINELFDAHPKYANMVPNIENRARHVVTQNYQYLAGEYFNQHWDICHFDTMVDKLEAAKLSYACSAYPELLVERFTFTPEQLEFLAPYKNTVLGECLGDLMINQQFRRDIFVKGLRKLEAKEHEAKVNQLYVMLAMPLNELPKNMGTQSGKEPLSKLHLKICGILGNYKPHSIGEIQQLIRKSNLAESLSPQKGAPNADQSQTGKTLTLEQQVNEAILELFGLKVLTCARDLSTITHEETQLCNTFNQKVLDGEFGKSITFLACPVFGAGYPLSIFDQQVLNVFKHLKEQAQAQGVSIEKFVKMIDLDLFVEAFASNLISTGQYVTIEKEKVYDRERMVPHLKGLITKFRNDKLPYYMALGFI